MKHLLTILLFIFVTELIFCQETKLIEIKFYKSKQISETYSVLISNESIKNGQYISYFEMSDDEKKDVKREFKNLDFFIKQKGNYKNGKREGEWIEFSQPNVIKTIGNYTNGVKTGIWKIYHLNGNVIEQYDYDRKIKLQPITVGENIKYPPKSRELEIEGDVTVKFKINNDCTISNIEIVSGLNEECDNEVIKSIQKLGQLLTKYGANCESKIETRVVSFKLN